MARNASLNRLMLLGSPPQMRYPSSGFELSFSKRLAICTRRVAATSLGVAPAWRRESRSRWRGPIPSLSARSPSSIPGPENPAQ